MKNRRRLKENMDKYGEFISSYFKWISLDEQKEKAEHLERLGRENKQ